MCHDEIKRELAADEKVLWEGRPPEGIRLREIDIFLIPFSVLWGGFAIAWEVAAITSMNAPLLGIVWGIPFVTMGLYLMVGRFFHDAARRRRVFYAVTARRILIVETMLSRKVTALNLEALGEVSYEDGWTGINTVTLGRSVGVQPFDFPHWPGMRRATPPQFELAENPRQVFELIRDAKIAVQNVRIGEVSHA